MINRAATDAFFLGLDASTQSLKLLLINRRLEPVAAAAVNFDEALPEFKTSAGAHRHADGLTVTAPPLMWAAALDLVLEKIRAAGAPLNRVAAISGSGQQHGSVWLRAGAGAALNRLDPARTLREQLAEIFALPESPIWMDASTAAQCAALERALGGPQALADLTGSRAYARFTGNQIAKIYAVNRAAYDATERIALVSSFMASLLMGGYASVDFSDGSGMNLLDIRARRWAPAALAACGDARLARMLGAPAPSHAPAGPLHAYYAQRYGFAPACQVVNFSGDNPCSLAGLRLTQSGAVALSLGTSDTLFGSTATPAPSGAEGHVFVSPVDPGAWMVMLVRKNASLMREHIRDLCAGRAWAQFNAHLQATPPGNLGRLGFYHRSPEITPPTDRTGIFRFDAQDRPVPELPSAADCRGVVESQFLCLRAHAAAIGLTPASLLVTGGASVNRLLVQIAADVFGTPALAGAQPDSAALGAAYRAWHGWLCRQRGEFVPFAEAVDGAPEFQVMARPDPAAAAVYRDLLPRYVKLENLIRR